MLALILGHIDSDEPHQLGFGIDERGCPLEIALMAAKGNIMGHYNMLLFSGPLNWSSDL
jgi:hypothetical protein